MTSSSSSTFTYLRVPADDAASVEELEARLDSVVGGDQLPVLLKSAFVGGGAVDEDKAMEEAARHLGAEQAAGISRERILGATANLGGKTETFALVHPSETNGHRGVYLYLDEVGMLKNKPTNARVSELAQRCGFDLKHSFHGDAYVGAVCTEPTMRNVDFTENELSPDAPWMVSAPRENEAYAVEMQSFMAAVRGKSVNEEQRRAVMASRGGGSGGGGDDAQEEEEGEEEEEDPEQHSLLSKEGLEEYFASLAAGVVTLFTRILLQLLQQLFTRRNRRFIFIFIHFFYTVEVVHTRRSFIWR